MTRPRHRPSKMLIIPLGLVFSACGGPGGTSTDASSGIGDGKQFERDAKGPGDASAARDEASDRDAAAAPDRRSEAELAPGGRDAAAAGQADARDAWRPDRVANDGENSVCLNLALENTAPWITETYVPEPPPARQGGTISLGLYHLTSYVRYKGVPYEGPPLPPVPEYTDAHKGTVLVSEPGTPSYYVGSLDVTFSSTKVRKADLGEETRVSLLRLRRDGFDMPYSASMQYICPEEYAGPVALYRYDATPSSLTLCQENLASPYCTTLTKQ